MEFLRLHAKMRAGHQDSLATITGAMRMVLDEIDRKARQPGTGGQAQGKSADGNVAAPATKEHRRSERRENDRVLVAGQRLKPKPP
jgi:hypothetical protein